MAFNLMCVFKSAVDWEFVNEEFHYEDRMFEVYPFSATQLGDGFGLSIANDNFDVETWNSVTAFLEQISQDAQLQVYDMYQGAEIDPSSYVPDGLEEK